MLILMILVLTAIMSMKIPGGTYKFSVGADRYEHTFRVLDESGSPAWSTNSFWENGSTLTLVEGNVTNLGSVSMSALEQSDADLYGFNWMDEGSQIAVSSIKGSVKTGVGSKGSVVPKARIIAHTDDYLFWFDHTISRSDGSFEISNLPAGNWLVFQNHPMILMLSVVFGNPLGLKFPYQSPMVRPMI